MRVFILYDPDFTAYPILGVYSTLEKARAAAYEDEDFTLPTRICVYEEETDQDDPPFEPVYHPFPDKRPT